MHTDGRSMSILPLNLILGPLAVVPLVDNTMFRYSQTVDQWMTVMPYRMWGDYFARTIEWEGNPLFPEGTSSNVAMSDTNDPEIEDCV